jgi:hypothetical protein
MYPPLAELQPQVCSPLVYRCSEENIGEEEYWSDFEEF